ncbi:twin-arginine translocase TatA/TatE family subunit [Alteromonas sp. 14N.309.X.WAT.G.H12]|uniref:twin-arginine translocase TatA/TatE family subunit n=1 Tax=Alteromonas sp. 14N.309.X.WAT.G.H12 TaxID=3120824 RepID=UPI002FD222E8
MGFNIWQLLLVLIVVILLFGRGRIPALMGDLASGIKSFKQGLNDAPATAESTSDSTAIPPPSATCAVKAAQQQEDPHA